MFYKPELIILVWLIPVLIHFFIPLALGLTHFLIPFLGTEKSTTLVGTQARSADGVVDRRSRVRERRQYDRRRATINTVDSAPALA
ncbi:MAG: hypothetical protein ABFS19_02985 [Thermodesulfobacteriota bacterium]